jgi:hypothetical protein
MPRLEAGDGTAADPSDSVTANTGKVQQHSAADNPAERKALESARKTLMISTRWR